MTLNANKDLIRRLFEEVFPAGDPIGVRDLVAPATVDTIRCLVSRPAWRASNM